MWGIRRFKVSKRTKMLQMVNLLCHRNAVSLETIKSVCELPTRTAYRYLNSLSEANVPVYFDKRAGGYRLMRQKYASFDDLSLNDAIILVTCLRVVVGHVNEEYARDIAEVMKKIVIRKQFPVEDLGGPTELMATAGSREPDYSPTITSALVEAAVLLGKRLEVSQNATADTRSTTGMEQPSLVFRNGWHVAGRKMKDGPSRRLSSVSKVKIA
jgi:predicted DNA-binding transcriptional regulator YafY